MWGWDRKHARIQKVLSEGVQLNFQLRQGFFRGREEEPNTTICRSSLTRQRNAIYRWRANDGWLGSFVIFRGPGPVLLRNAIFLWFYMGVRTSCPPLDPRMENPSQGSPFGNTIIAEWWQKEIPKAQYVNWNKHPVPVPPSSRLIHYE